MLFCPQTPLVLRASARIIVAMTHAWRRSAPETLRILRGSAGTRVAMTDFRSWVPACRPASTSPLGGGGCPEDLTRLPPALSWEERAPFQNAAPSYVRRDSSKQKSCEMSTTPVLQRSPLLPGEGARQRGEVLRPSSAPLQQDRVTGRAGRRRSSAAASRRGRWRSSRARPRWDGRRPSAPPASRISRRTRP